MKATVVLGVNLFQDEGSPDQPGFTNWLRLDNQTGSAATTINGFGVSATGVNSDVGGNGFRSLDSTASYFGPLANLTET